MLKLSEAASLAMHTMALLVSNPGKQASAKEIAARLNVSEAHLAKVLQRLARYGLVHSARGPKGGFRLNGSYSNISLLDIYESVEGPFRDRHCFRTTKACGTNHCIFGGLLGDVSHQVREYLEGTKLPDLAGLIGAGNGRPQENNPDR